MITLKIGLGVAKGRDLVARGLIRLGIKPNTITFMGLVVNAFAALLFGSGQFLIGGIVMVLASPSDMLDGAVAKLSGKGSKFGAFFDSAIDRYSDLILLSGLLVYFFRTQRLEYVLLCLSAMIGSVLVSYSRARAENFIPSCKVGFWTRGERIVVLMCATLIDCTLPALWLLGTLTHLTVIQRMLEARRVLAPSSPGQQERPGQEGLCAVGRAFFGFGSLLRRIIFWDFERGSIPYDIAIAAIAIFCIALRFLYTGGVQWK